VLIAARWDWLWMLVLVLEAGFFLMMFQRRPLA
jgi:hypothetical protein